MDEMRNTQPGTAPASEATDELDPPSPTKPCWGCGTTNPADHGPNDECPEFAADQQWLDEQMAARDAARGVAAPARRW